MPPSDAAPVDFASLGDLTGVAEHRSRALPEVWIDALTRAFPDAEVHVEEPRYTSELHALIPGTRIVIRMKPFVLDLIRSTAGLWLVAATVGSAPTASVILAAANILDAFRRMKTAIETLDEKAGEACTYVSVVRAGEAVLRKMNAFPEADDIWKAHQDVRSGCQMTTCQYHDGSACAAVRENVDVVLERLVKRGVLERRGTGTWPTT